jgi:hypothetical protein
LGHLAETGADWIALVVTCYQDNIASTRIFPSEATPTDADLIHVIRQAHAIGLKVMLKPHLDLWKDAAHWRGEIGPAFKSEVEWSDWFASYRTFIEHYADLASSHGADQFCVGTELEGTTQRAADWRKIIAAVRSRYSGPVIYAGNHDGEETRLTWWDAVDIIGVDAYYPLATRTKPTLAELKAAWQPRVAILAGLAARWQKRIILTEIGYRSIEGAAMHPWDWQVKGTISLQEQADCYRAAFESCFSQAWLAGLYWWSWGPDPLEGGPEDDGYTPHDKPAEDVIRAFYGGAARVPARTEPEPSLVRTMAIFTDGLDSGWQDRSWSAVLDYEAVDSVLDGKTSLRAELAGWGALSLGHRPFAAHPYFWLEFAIRSPSGVLPPLWAYLYDGQGAVLRRVSINDSRYIRPGAGADGSWSIISIPLRDMGAARKILSRVSIQENSGKGTGKFWVDDLRLVGANRRGDRQDALSRDR